MGFGLMRKIRVAGRMCRERAESRHSSSGFVLVVLLDLSLETASAPGG